MPQVTLNYDPNDTTRPFGPDPDHRRIKVKAGDTITFQLGPGTLTAKPGSKLRITIHDNTHFDANVVHHSQAEADGARALPVRVRTRPDRVVGYRCELLDRDLNPIAGLSSDSTGAALDAPGGGGEIEPDSTA